METAASAATHAATGPVKTFRLDDIAASIFARERVVQGETVTFYSVSFSRAYKDAKGQWKYTNYFDSADLAKVMFLAKQAGEYIDTRPPRSVARGED